MTANGEWPLIGAALGLPSPPQISFSSWDDPSHDQSAYCAPPAVAQRLQQLYQDSLRHFDQVYISSSAVLRSRNQSYHQVTVNTPQPPQQHAKDLPPQPTEVHHQTLLAHVPPESGLGVPQHAIAFVEQNAQPVNLTQLNLTSGVQVAAHSSLQSTQSHMQQQQQKEVCLAPSIPFIVSVKSSVPSSYTLIFVVSYIKPIFPLIRSLVPSSISSYVHPQFCYGIDIHALSH